MRSKEQAPRIDAKRQRERNKKGENDKRNKGEKTASYKHIAGADIMTK